MKNKKGSDPKKLDFSVNKVRFLQQNYWEEGSTIDFTKKARTTSGFLHLNSCDARLFLSGGREIFLESGNCIYLPKGSRYRLVFSGVSDQVPSFLINCVISYGGEEMRLYKEPVLLPREKELEIRNVFSKLTANSSSAEIKSAVWSLISLWIEGEREEKDLSQKAPSYLKKAKMYLEQNTDSDIAIASLAKICGVSPSYFRKQFKKYFSLSPKEYSLQRRLDAARRYLETGELNVSEVSKLLSFSSPSYFSRLFKEKNGVSPIAFMKNSRR